MTALCVSISIKLTSHQLYKVLSSLWESPGIHAAAADLDPEESQQKDCEHVIAS